MARRRLALAVLLGCTVWLAASPPVRADWSIEQLMAGLAEVPEVEAVFHERKEMTVLEAPLELSGMLRYRAPDALEKEVLYPEPVRYAILADRVVIVQPDGRRQEFALDQYPLLRVLTESMRATMAGDLATLTRLYRVALSGDQAAWQLRLEPLDETVAQRVTAIIISGSGQRVEGVETLESGGDRSVMTITPAAG